MVIKKTISLLIIAMFLVTFFLLKISLEDCNYRVKLSLNKTGEKLNYKQLINSTLEAQGYLGMIDESLFLSDDFIRVYENPTLYFEDAKKIINDESYNLHKRNIALKSMFKLPADKFSYIIDDIFESYQKNKSDANLSLLKETIYSPFGRQHLTSYCYKNKHIKKVLLKIADKEVSLKKDIYDKLSGKSRWRLKKYYLTQEI